MNKLRSFLLGALVLTSFGGTDLAAENGRIEGRVTRADSAGVAGVAVTLDNLGKAEITGRDGAFVFADVPPGTYTLTFTLGKESVDISALRVEAGQTAQVEKVVDWTLSFAETLTVYSASRRQERIVEAPAAITSLSAAEIVLVAPSGQLPRMLEFTVGAELTQTGLYDFNLNCRGLNRPLNRRVQTLIDGRDPSIPFVSSQEWATLSFLSNDLATVKLLRGPSAALYGANTFNGVLNLTTKAPRDSQGGEVRATAGELETATLSFRWAGEIAKKSYLKTLAYRNESEDFARDRNESVEYPGLDLEAVAREATDNAIEAESVRFDRYLSKNQTLTIEGGISNADGITFLTAAGRSQALRADRTWARFNYYAPRLNFLGTYNRRVGEQFSLSAGSRSFLDSWNYRFELQGNRNFARSRGRIVAGVSYGEEDVDSADPKGNQTLFAAAIRSDESAVFGQLDYDASQLVKLVLAVRWDDSSLHDPVISPKMSLVLSLKPRHVLRFGYNEAFQIPTHADLFLELAAGLPIDLSFVETAFAPRLGGVSLALDSVPIFALGNRDLEVEKIQSIEVGYTGILGERAFLTVDYYRNRTEDFITDLLPGVNASFPPYRAPEEVAPEVAREIEAFLNAQVFGLSNDARGNPLLVYSFGNTGKVDSQGLEVSLSYGLGERWGFNINYSWFDFKLDQGSTETAILPNTPKSAAAASLNFHRGRVDAALRYRWVDRFQWAAGGYDGLVPAFSVVNFAGSYHISEQWRVGVDISNVLDDKHFEAFGGDLLSRRGLGWVSFSW